MAEDTWSGWVRALFRRLQRRRARIIGRSTYTMYAMDLSATSVHAITPKVDVEFRVNCPKATKILQLSDERYDTGPRQVRAIPLQLAAGEICVSGWANGQLAYYAWVQFEKRRLAQRTSVPLAKGQAAIYRCFTRQDFRGKRIYPAALHFTFQWLARNGYRRVLIDHDVQNKPSQRGIEISGMKPVGEYRVYKLLWLKWATLDDDLRTEISATVLSLK